MGRINSKCISRLHDTNEHWRYLILHLLYTPSFKSINFSMQASWTCDKSVVTDIVIKSIRMFQNWYCDRYLYLFLILSVQTRMYRWNHLFFFQNRRQITHVFPANDLKSKYRVEMVLNTLGLSRLNWLIIYRNRHCQVDAVWTLPASYNALGLSLQYRWAL